MGFILTRTQNQGQRCSTNQCPHKTQQSQNCYAYGLLLTRMKSTYRLITIRTVYENGPGLSRDNPLCLPFCFTLFSDRFSEVPDSCTIQRYQMVDGSASEAL